MKKQNSAKKSPTGAPLGNPLKFFREGGEKRKAMFKKGGYNTPTQNLPKAQEGITTYSKNSFLAPSGVYNKEYKTTKDGKVISNKSGVYDASTVGGASITSVPTATTILDTTGYSKGKQNFTAKKASSNAADINYDNPGTIKINYTEWDVPRNQVKKTIDQMKSGSGANKKPGTNVNYNSAGTKTVVHTGKDGKKYVKVTTADGKTYNKVIKKGSK